MATSSLSSLSRRLTDVGKSLSVQAVLVDSQIFRRDAGRHQGQYEMPPSLRPVWDPSRLGNLTTKEMLVKQVRSELKARGLDAIGKPAEIRNRLAAARAEDEENEEALLSRIGGAPAKSEAPPKKADVGVDVRAKYAAKLKARLAEAPETAPEKQRGDAEHLSRARELASATPASKWCHGPPGLRTLLDFVRARSMLLALVPRPDADAAELDDVMRQSGVVFDLVSDDRDLEAACAALGVPPAKALAFLDDLDAVPAAASAGTITCLLKPDDGLEKPLLRRPQFSVANCVQVIDVLNDLNGISFRGTVPVY